MYRDDVKLEEFPKIPFGKYRDTRMDRLSMSYLTWLMNNVSDGYLRAAAYAAYNNLNAPDPKSFVKLYYQENDPELVVIDASFKLIDDIREIQGRRWNAETKEWTVPRCEMKHVHDLFPKAVLIGKIAKRYGNYFTIQKSIEDYLQQTL